MINRPARTRAAGALLAGIGFFGLSTALSSCSGGVSCLRTGAGPDATFVGRLTGLQGATATYAIEKVTLTSARQPTQPVLATGQSVAVRYTNDEEQFLRVGRRYAVGVWWDGAHFSSGVHTADSCSYGTTRADGTPIDTSSWSQPWLHRALVAIAVVPLLALVLLALWLRHRHHRKTRASIGS